MALAAIAYSAQRREKQNRSALLTDQRNVELFVNGVPTDGLVPVVFQLTNRLDRPVRILGIDKSCNCFEATG
jgi:hypothetical protein